MGCNRSATQMAKDDRNCQTNVCSLCPLLREEMQSVFLIFVFVSWLAFFLQVFFLGWLVTSIFVSEIGFGSADVVWHYS